MAIKTPEQRAAETNRRELPRPQQGRGSDNPALGYGSGYLIQEKAPIVGPPVALPGSARRGR